MHKHILHIILWIVLALCAPAMTLSAQIDPKAEYSAQSKIRIGGNVYGGGNEAAVQGNTNVTINTGEYGGSIFGGGNGALYTADDEAANPLHKEGSVKSSADIGTHNDDGTLKEGTGDTHVTINGGELVYYIGDKDNFRNIYGGGNAACNVAGSTHVRMNKGMITAWSFVSSDLAVTAWQYFWDNHNSNTKQPICAVFGAGYGANTDVALDTHVEINLGEARTEEYSKEDLVLVNNFVTRDGPNPALSQKFVSGVFGGGYNGTVGAYSVSAKGINRDDDASRTADDYLSNTNVTIGGSPYTFTVFGGGLGSKRAADLDEAAGQWGSRVGAVFGGTKVDIEGGFVFGSVFGGGAGIYGAVPITTPREGDMPYINAAQVFRETDVTINGAGTVVIGNVYGGGDIANTGWYTAGTRPNEPEHVEQVNMSLAKLDYTTSVHLLGGNVMGQVFGGANGRTKSEITLAHLIGAVIGSTNLQLGEDVEPTDGKLHGTTVWNRIYGGCNVGQVYACAEIAANRGQAGLARAMAEGVTDGCTSLTVYNGKMAHDIFAGGFGDINDSGTPDDPSDDVITSADISGNTYVYFKRGDLEWEHYWDAKTANFIGQSSAIGHWGEEQDVCHNLYGGGNMACVVKGNSHVYMSGAPAAPDGFTDGEYWNACIANVALPHFSVFGGGFGINAKINGNAYSDINLRIGSGFHSIIGGGMNGPVGGMCKVHVGNDPYSRVYHIYGGGYYAPCEKTELNITRGTIVKNVFGGSVMGNITPYQRDADGNLVLDGEGNPIPDTNLYATKTVIGLQDEGAGRYSSFDVMNEEGTLLRSYTYAEHQNQITIGGNVYGANDVSGTVNGIASLTIYGGTIQGQVYGAGNGNHIGYYVPNELKYNMGAHGTANYYYVNHGTPETTGNTYVGRPQTIGGVELTLEGNTETERVKVLGQVFGGGNSCTIGDWDKELLKRLVNPHAARDSANYFLGGGKLYVNIGSHVTIGRTHKQLAEDPDGSTYIDNDENVSGLFMGCSGRDLATQNGDYLHDNYYHHFYNYNVGKYYPGFAVGDESGTPMTRAQQLKPFQAYLNNVMIWTDDIRLRINNHDGSAAEDVWIANFVGGGFRGSMRAKTVDGTFDYTIPEGVTVSHTVVGGAYNAHVRYHYFDTKADGTFVDAKGDGVYDYATVVPDGWEKVDPAHPEVGDYIDVLHENPEDPEQITSIVRYNFNGGILSENSTGVSASEVGHHIHRVHADPREKDITDEERRNRYATSYFQPMSEDTEDPAKEDAETRAKLFTANKDKVLLHLDLQCAMEPEVLDDSEGTYLHGGNVFGGCFLSGFVEGDSWVDYNCWLSPACTDPKYFSKDKNWGIYHEAMDVERNNALNVYGAGYGNDTHSMGDVYLSVKAIDQTAGGDDDTHGHFPYIFNAFGGSNMGEVDGNVNVYYAVGKQGTLLGSLYGGGFKGVINGNTFVELAEGFVNNVYGGSRQADIMGAAHVWAYDGKARGIENANHLIICNLYGGNDIAGTIHGTMPAYFTESKWSNKREPIAGHTFNTYVEISADDNSADRGFPLVGSAFAGGNGEAWVSEEESGTRPNVAKALIEIEGGSTLRAFGGGNMATVTDSTFIFTDAKSTHFADVTFTEYQKQIVQNIFFRDVTVGYKWENNRLTMENFHVARLFGGNNLATMDIQPTWNLKAGRLDNVYSGGNMGDMTYYNPAGKPATKNGDIGQTAGVENNEDGSNANYSPRGLSITIDEPKIYIGSLFGGCRLSDVNPTPKGEEPAWPAGTDGEDFYGATINILDGYINNVYGGNDISGTVYHGTNVNISGAVSGNVYGSGNGFYLYKWDKSIDWDSPEQNPYQTNVIEEFNEDLKELIYHVKPMAVYGGDGANNTQKMLTINDYRPSVEKAFLNISGREGRAAVGEEGDPDYKPAIEKRIAYVKGNVFCGGNASTIIGDNSFTKFKIGSYVTLNGVFMGSDGKAYTENDHIKRFATLNGIDNMGEGTEPSSFLDYDGAKSLDQSHNPILLNIYMMAVDMKAQPKDFNLNLPLKEAHIGTYCGGGNRGSMLVDKTVTLPFHHDIIIYDKIVAACLDANIDYNDGEKHIYSMGGYTRKITDNATYGNKKFKLDIASQFVPLVMDVPADKSDTTRNSHGETFSEAEAHGFLYDNRQKGVKYTYEEFNELFQTTYDDQATFEKTESDDHIWKIADGIYAPSCNIYGGCYQSGEVEGDIELNIYSNMLRYVDQVDLDKSLAQNIACFNVYGAGFGQNSHVWGNVTINMDRSLDKSTMGDGTPTISENIKTLLGGESRWDIQHSEDPSKNLLGIANAYQYPSFNNVIGGGRNGKLIGNTTVEIRNGLVYSDVAGGCYASDMYGSTQVIVGYPKYYKCLTTGEYQLDRADKWNTDKVDTYGDKVIKQSVWYLKGDLVPDNVYQMIVAKTPGNASSFELVDIQPEDGKNTATHTINGVYDGTTWNDVHIKVGKGIYGGGYSLQNSMAASAGSITTYKLLDDAATTTDLHPHNFSGRYGYDETSFAGYGGNSSVMLADQEEAAQDHIRVSTLKTAVANIPATSSVIGKFIKETVDGKEVYTHQGDHTPDEHVTYYTLTGDGGIYGDGHLTFCEGFRSADVTRYGWADGTAKHPILMNTFQRMDLLSVNDCCLMLQGAQDFATDQIDATMYSITRVNEMRLNSSLDANATLGEISAHSGSGEGPAFTQKKQRNYLAFFNNVHYLGSIVTNDPFTSNFHKNDGTLDADTTYIDKKLAFINRYAASEPDANGNKPAAATTAFKKRNVGTARNAIGINNGYCLRIQNQEYVGAHQSKTYYGPIVGVCEVKLLTLVQGEGGGYVYADNIHEYPNKASGEDHFLMTSGNFVFPGIINQGKDPITDEPIGDQYIVDDCFVQHFGTPGHITERDHSHELDEAHYWYVEGNKYFFTTTLTGFTYKHKLDFDLVKTDPNIVLSGMENGSRLNIKKIEWLSAETGFHRKNYEPVLPTTAKETDEHGNVIDKISDYEFDITVGGNDITDWHSDMPRYSVPTSGPSFTTDKTVQNDHLPQFNIRLQDKLDNSGDAAYNNHLDEPELVKIYFVGQTEDENHNWQTYEYTITVNVVYLQGPTVKGGVKIKNCALPGELIGFSTDGLEVKTPELMPITAASWQILPLSEIDEHGEWKWDMENGIVIPDSRYHEDPETQNVIGTIPALYKQNEYTIAYIFTAGGYDFPVMPEQTATTPKENRMIVVHNYHRMKDVVDGVMGINHIPDLQIETMPSTIPDHQTRDYHPKFAEAKIYIEDEADLRAFIEYLNLATATYTDGEGVEHAGNEHNIPVGLTDLDIILQKDITLTSPLPDINVAFAGNLHGDGYHIDLGEHGSTLLGDSFTGNVYNLGLIGGTIASADATGTRTNCYEIAKDSKDVKVFRNGDSEVFKASKALSGELAYELSHFFAPTSDGYVESRYANGDYLYATTDRVWSLRTAAAPNYGYEESRHDTTHLRDLARWDEVAGVYKPLYDGTITVKDTTVDISGNGTEYFTYRGLPAGYANDYLFFGQHLDKLAADGCPVHIDPLESDMDAAGWKGGNRVYEANGYYRSKVQKDYYYNKDAWALNQELTAIDFTQATPEGDNAETAPTRFSKDEAVSQNLLVYNGGEDAFDEHETEDIAEENVVYHNIVKSAEIFSTDYMHVVDEQDFNAPIAFTVNERTWYEREPESYATISSKAWDGIILPFSPHKVSGSEHGEITHFYGEHPSTQGANLVDTTNIGHEYWLRGFVDVEAGAGGDVSAIFARPALETTAVTTFPTATADCGEYSYYNPYWTSLYGSDEFSIYSTARTYTDYAYQMANVPYLVAFPGEDYYEFDMNGETVTYERLGEHQIQVTDDYEQVVTIDGYTHRGTMLNTDEARAFRTYFIKDSTPLTMHVQGRDDRPVNVDEDNEPVDPSHKESLLRVFTTDRKYITIQSSESLRLPMYDAVGRLITVLDAPEGESVHYVSVEQGVYVVGNTRVIL